MDEYDRGLDPEVTQYFRKIMSSFSSGLLWLLVAATSGLYFRLALIDEKLRWFNVLYYVCFVVSLILLIRRFIKIWNN
jgi:hypothetical protein